MSQEQDAAFFRNFTLILVALAVFGVFAAIMGRHFAAMVDKDAAPSAEQVTPATETKHE
ncbi:MAG TPA: hypothetical protein VJL59_03205 [Anaerolineales bacterium]|nr:hypothetical protein [Anaerolineales bacterium]